jgi:hypothetical protein
MAFMTGFFLVIGEYRSEPKRSELKQYLESLGFEIYDVGKPSALVFYVEGETIKELEDKIKLAEQHDGIAKAYIAYGFTGSRELQDWLNEALERGEIELDQTTINYLKTLLQKIGVKEQA